METKVLHINDEKDEAQIQEAARLLREGELVIFPTETVYGLGGNGLDEGAVDKIFRAKGRPKDNPLILHVADPEQVLDLVKVIPPKGKDCMDVFWPGPLTLIFERSKKVSDSVTAGADTVAIRMPSHPIAHAILKAAAVPVAAPSANTSGRPSPTRLAHVLEDMDGKVPLIVDSGDANVGIESTVLDVTVDPPMIYRPGGVTKEDLEAIIGEVAVDETTIDVDNDAVPKSPGQKYRHYAPKGDATLFAGDLKNIAKEINRRVKEADPGKRTAVLCTTETKDLYEGMDLLVDMGSRRQLEAVAHNLFESLRRCDEEDIDLLFVEGFDFRGLGVGIMNRLLKACGGKVVLGL